MTKTKPATVAADRLKSFIERYERLDEERAAVSGDMRDVLAEAKGVGYDATTIRWLVKERKVDVAERDERDQLRDVYAHALGMAVNLVEAGGMSLRKAAKRTGISKSSLHRALAVPGPSQPARSGHDPNTGEITPPVEMGRSAAEHATDSMCLSGRVSGSDEHSKSCGGGESRPAETTSSLDCGGGAAREEMPASEETAPASAGRALDAGGAIPPRSNPALGSATGRNGDTAGVAPGPQDLSDEQEAPAARDQQEEMVDGQREECSQAPEGARGQIGQDRGGVFGRQSGVASGDGAKDGEDRRHGGPAKGEIDGPTPPLGAGAEGDSPQRVASPVLTPDVTTDFDPGPIPSRLDRRNGLAPAQTPPHPNERIEGAA